MIVLDDEEEREPTLDEVKEYAEFLGIDCNKEPHLMWIAQQGVVAKVPPPWKACMEQGGDDVFYFNYETRESVWEHPCDELFRNMLVEHRAKPAAASPTSNGERAASDSGSGLGDVETDEELAEQEEKLLNSDPRDLEARVHTMMWDTTPNPSPQGKSQMDDLSETSPVSGGMVDAHGTVRSLDKQLKKEEEEDSEEEEEEHIYVDENYSPTLRGSKKIKLGSLKEEEEDREEDKSKSSAMSTPASSPDANDRMEAQRKRLQLITNELSDDESLSRSSTPLNSSIDSVGGRAGQSDHSSPGKAGSSSRKRLEVGHSPGSPSGGKMSRRAQEVSAGACMTIQRVWRGQRVRRKLLALISKRRQLAGQKLVGNRFDSGAILLRHGERNLRWKERCHGSDHPEVAPALLQLAEHQARAAASDGGDCPVSQKQQLDTLERALRIMEAHHGHSSVELVDVLTLLAGVRRAFNYFREEQEVLSRIERIKASVADEANRGSAGVGLVASPQANSGSAEVDLLSSPQANRGSAGVGLVASPQANRGSAGVGLVASPHANRGSAGVGLVASPKALVIETLAEEDEEDEDDDITEDTFQSSATSANLSNPSQSHSGSRGIPSGPGKAVAVARQLLGLEHSHSGQSGKSSNLSEVSEDFPSDFDIPSPDFAPAVWNATLGDSLELSVTGTMDEGLTAAASAAMVAVPDPSLAAAAVATVNSFSPLIGADEVSAVHKPVEARVQSVKADIQTLTRILSALRDIRVQQSEYVHGLKGLAAGSSSLLA